MQQGQGSAPPASTSRYIAVPARGPASSVAVATPLQQRHNGVGGMNGHGESSHGYMAAAGSYEPYTGYTDDANYAPPHLPHRASVSSEREQEYGGGGAAHGGSPVTALAAGQNGVKSQKRTIQSCSECKRRKIKCNRVYPCGPCILRGEESICKEVEKVEPVHTPVPTMADFELALARIAQLEESVAGFQETVSSLSMRVAQPASGSGRPHPSQQIYPHMQAQPQYSSSSNSAQGYAIQEAHLFRPASANARTSQERTKLRGNGKDGEHASEQGHERERDHEAMAMMLEDFAMNNRANRDRAAKIMSTNVPTATPVLAASTLPHRTGQEANATSGAKNSSQITSPPPRLPGITQLLPPLPPTYDGGNGKAIALLEMSHPLSGLVHTDTDYIAKLVAQAPDPLRGWRLVQYYFTHLEWYSRVLHAPTFIDECKHLLSLPPASVSGRVRPSFLATYFVVLCISLQYVGEGERSELGMTVEQARSLSMRMFSAAQGLLWLCDFLGAHSLEHLQVIVLMGVYQYNVGQADSHVALLGSGIKIAQNIGLSRLGAEQADVRWPDAWTDPLRREIGRRVWWNLIFLDWSHAIAHNGCYSIHPSQNFTVFPSNVNDDDLVDGTIAPKPWDQHTDASFTIAKMRFVCLYRELVDHQTANSPPSYSFILEMDTKIVRTLDSLPSFFRGATPPADSFNDSLVMECLLIQLIGETRLLRLHRPYLSRGYKDRKFSSSKDRCVNSARSILVLLKTAEKAAPILLGTWLVLFYGFGAAVVTFIDLCHGTARGDSAACEEKRGQIRDMITLLRNAQHISDAARNAITLLEGLLAAEEDLVGSTGTKSPNRINKRKADASPEEGEPFRRVVKKLLIDAALSQPELDPRLVPSPPLAATTTGIPQFSPATQGSSQLLPGAPYQLPDAGASNQVGYQTFQPPPFQPDFDIFLEGSKSYAPAGGSHHGHQFHLPGASGPNLGPHELSQVFLDDMISSLFANDGSAASDPPANSASGAWAMQ